MIKQFIVYLSSFAVLSFVGYLFHTSLLPTIAIESPMSLMHLYLFFAIFSSALCMLFEFLHKIEKFKDQLGFLYLVSVALKIGIFCILFYAAIFSEDSFTNRQSINLLIPMFLTIILEVFFVSKLLNKLSPIKND